MNKRCHFCAMELDPSSPAVWRHIVAWERKASGGSRRGGSDVALRQPYGDIFACDPCIDHQKRGLSPNQGGMF